MKTSDYNHQLPRKWSNRRGLLPACLMALIALGAIVGTVLLTAAPGTASPRPKNLIVRVLDFILPGKEKQESSLEIPVPKTAKQAWTPSDRAGGVSHEVAAASKTVTTATTNEIRTDSGRIADSFAGNNTMTFPGIETGTKTQSGANARSGGTTSSGGTLVAASGSTADVSASGTTTAVIDPDGTWTRDGNGNWGTTTNWLGGIITDGGGFADFSMLNITGAGDRVVTIDAGISRTVRRIDIGDTNNTTGYTIAASPGAKLIFDNTANSANAQLNEVMTSNGDTISAPIVLNSSLDITNASAATLTLSGAITSGTAGTKIITTSTGAVTISGVISDGSGTVAVTQNGPGTLTLSNANTYTGGTLVSGGTLALGSNTAVGTGTLTLSDGATLRSSSTTARTLTNSLSLSGSIILGDATNSGALTFNTGSAILTGDTILNIASVVTINEAIGGAFSLTKDGASSLTLGATNTYSGGTTLDAGTLNINNASALGTGTFTIDGGTINNTSVGAITLSTNNAQVWNSDFTFTGTQSLNLGTGAVSLGTAPGTSRTITVSANTLTVGGIISNGTTANSLIKAGAGILTLSGANTYSGGITLTAGTLNINNASALGTGTFTIAGGTIDNTSGSALTLTNAQSWSGNFVFTGTNDLTFTGAVTLGSNRTVTVNGGNLTENGIISGGFSLTKAGAGTLTLGAANTYSGATSINAGTLSISALSNTGTNSTINIGSTTTAGTLLYTGTGETSTKVINLAGTTGGAVIDQSGTGLLKFTSNFTATGAGSKTLTLQGTGIGEISGAIVDNSGANKTSLVKAGTGTWTLSGANTYTGATTISAGILNIQNDTALGTTAGDTTVSSGATLQLQGGITVGAAEALTISGTGAAGQNGALVNVSGTNSYGGGITLAADTTISSDSGTLNLSGAVNNGGNNLTVDGTGDTVITGVVSGNGDLIKSDSGTLTLTGANTYKGVTSVNAGTLLVNNTAGSGTGTGAVTVNNNGTTLGGTGIISGNVTVNSGANIKPGNGGSTTGILTINGALTLAPGSNFLVNINGTTPGTGYSQLLTDKSVTITGSNLIVTVGTTLTIGQSFVIMDVEKIPSVTGTFVQGSSVTSGIYTFSISYAGGPGGDANDVVLTVAIPEPGTWIGGVFALIVLGYTQRRRLARCAKHLPIAAAVPAAISAMRFRICSRAGSRSSVPFCKQHACRYSALAVAFPLLIPIGIAKAIPLKEAKITQVIQDVRLLESSASPRAASINDDVREGTAVRTGSESRAELTFTDQTLTRLGANTLFNFNAESRTVELGSGAVLIYVPKNAGGAKIRAGTVTGAITGTTVTVEYDRRPPGFIKYTVLEGSMCIRLNGEAVPIYAGQQLVFSPNATSLPQPVSIDLKRLLETSQLTTGSPRPLPSAALIAGEAQHQRETRAIIDQLVHAVTLAGAPNVKDASAATFISAFSSLVIRAKDEEVCLYTIAAVTQRPDLIGEILVATRKSRKGEPRFTCECLERIIRAAIAADPKAAGDIIKSAIYAEPYARTCVANADPCEQGASFHDPTENSPINPADLISDPAVVSPER